MSLIRHLKETKKGQLSYDRNPIITREFLDTCSVPPRLSGRHVEISTHNSFCYPDGEEKVYEDFSSNQNHREDFEDSLTTLKNFKIKFNNSLCPPKQKIPLAVERNEFLDTCSVPPRLSGRHVEISTHNSFCYPDGEEKVYEDFSSNQNQGEAFEDSLTTLKNFHIKFNNSLCPPKQKILLAVERNVNNDRNVSLNYVDTNKSRSQIIVSPEYGKNQAQIHRYEEDLLKKAQIAFDGKRRLFKEAEKAILEQAENDIKKHDAKRREKAEQLQKKTEQQVRQGFAEVQEQQRKLKEDHKHHAKMLEKKHERIQHVEEEKKKREEERLIKITKMKKVLSDSKSLLERMKSLYLPHHDKLPENVSKGIQKAEKNLEKSVQIVAKDNEAGELTHEQFIQLTENLKFMSNLYDFVKQMVDECKEKEKREAAEAKAKAEEAKKKAELAKSETSNPGEPLVSSTPIPGGPTLQVPQNELGATGGPLATSTPMPSSSQISKPKDRVAEGEVLCVDVTAYEEYTKLQRKRKDAETAIQVLSSAPQLKKLKFDLQKAVNTPINAISAVSGEHMRDKLQRLLVLLSGQQVEITNKKVSVQEHPAALPFCKYLIAKMVVKKGEEQVSSMHESAFPIAAVTVGVLLEHPDILGLLLGQFHALCPYTVPYHMPKQQNQSSEEYLKSLGYKYDSDGNVEKQDKFLKRMSGIMRLYAALMVSAPHKRQTKHPFGIEQAWLWLSRVMNIQPLSDVTATMVYDLLEVTGHALYKEYRKQFLKMLHILIKEYLPKLKSVASPSGGGPVSRLEALINSSIQRHGQISPPEGLLSQQFWFS